MPTTWVVIVGILFFTGLNPANAFTYKDDYQDYLKVTRELSELTGPVYQHPEFIDYEKEYLRTLNATEGLQPLDDDLYFSEIDKHQVVILSDYHGSLKDQEKLIKVFSHMAKGESPVTLVLEWIDGRNLQPVNDYLNFDLAADALKQALLNDANPWPFDISGYLKTLSASQGVVDSVLLAENFNEDRTLLARDEAVADTIEKHQKTHPDQRYLVFYGAYHILGDNHLQDQIANRGLGRPLAITSYGDEMYWKINKSYENVPQYTMIDQDVLFEVSDTPLELKKSELRQARREASPPPEWDADTF
ncbi:MAG: hypothetical protein H6626_14595 [Pseudobdellovibrionaceae bacterium]|nr:hypothetical protein [Bdellovibrionales bacterium]USN47393.1 MAG: hypothetical protein H6626_14595 [Pseudobdellovibrionaceae bacterium]